MVGRRDVETSGYGRDVADSFLASVFRNFGSSEAPTMGYRSVPMRGKYLG